MKMITPLIVPLKDDHLNINFITIAVEVMDEMIMRSVKRMSNIEFYGSKVPTNNDKYSIGLWCFPVREIFVAFFFNRLSSNSYYK